MRYNRRVVTFPPSVLNQDQRDALLDLAARIVHPATFQFMDAHSNPTAMYWAVPPRMMIGQVAEVLGDDPTDPKGGRHWAKMKIVTRPGVPVVETPWIPFAKTIGLVSAAMVAENFQYIFRGREVQTLTGLAAVDQVAALERLGSVSANFGPLVEGKVVSDFDQTYTGHAWIKHGKFDVVEMMPLFSQPDGAKRPVIPHWVGWRDVCPAALALGCLEGAREDRSANYEWARPLRGLFGE